MLFSLIIATVDRVSDLESLFESLTGQECKDFEVILVDQNADNRVGPVLEKLAQSLNIRRIKSSIRNNSHARNLGMAIAAGEIIGFPDDDCLYQPGTLDLVRNSFEAEGDLAFLTGPALAYEGHLGPGRWHAGSVRIDVSTVWTCITEFNFFVRAAWMRKINGFDESFGLGARFGSAEGIDVVLRIMKLGGRGFYDYDLRIIHPDKGLVPFTVARAFQYGTGLGQALRKHAAPSRITMAFMVRPIGGALVNVMRLRPVAAAYHWQTLLGRLYGYLSTAG